MAKAWIKVSEGRWRLVDTGATAVASRADAPFIRKEHLTPRARRALAIQLGVPIESESQLRAHMKREGLRFVDRGEHVEKVKRDRKEWLRDTKPGERGREPFTGPRGYSNG